MFNFGIISTINKVTRGKQHYATKVNFIHKNSVLNTKIQEQPFNRCSSKFRNIHRKGPVLESLFNNVAGIRTATLLKRETATQALSCEYYEIFKNTFLNRI